MAVKDLQANLPLVAAPPRGGGFLRQWHLLRFVWAISILASAPGEGGITAHLRRMEKSSV